MPLVRHCEHDNGLVCKRRARFFVRIQMERDFEKAVEEYITANGLLLSIDRVLLAVSGGADSMAMLHALQSLRCSGRIASELCVGHVNHQLRGEASDGDEAFVMQEAQRLGLRMKVISVDVRGHAQRDGLSRETAARRLRHQGLARIASELGCAAIATAHQKDDNAETVIHRLLRGAGYRGLAGIWPRKEFANGITCIRPLLNVTRRQTEEYLAGRGLSWRVDASNENTEYTRNFIRHRLLPYMMQQASGRLDQSLAQLAAACRDYYVIVSREADNAWMNIVRARGPEGLEIDRHKFSDCVPVVQVEIIQRCLDEIGCGQQAVTAGHYHALIRMASQQSGGRRLSLPGGAVAMCHHDTISLSTGWYAPYPPPPPRIITIPGATEFGPWRITTRLLDAGGADIEAFKRTKTRNIEWFDLARISGGVCVRCRQEGDRFTPIGSYHRQKVGKFLTAARVSAYERARVAIFEDAARVVWLAPIRSSADTQVSVGTATILEIALSPAERSEPDLPA